MANYWPGVMLDIQGAVASVWPEIGAQFEIVVAKKVNWYNLLKDKQLSNMYVVFQIVSVEESMDWGINSVTMAMTAKLFYIELDPGTGVVSGLFGKLKLMQDFLLTNTAFATIQVLDEGLMLDVGEDESAAVMIESNMPLTAGSVGFQCLFGE
ncbi:MAG: hypothetical protein JWN14_2467 [Chthonomonadales bacterium]|nr:hypothetical protein [Chthonomonadales bacterium]